MMRSLMLGLALALPVAASAQPLYRWVEKDGTVRYSDQPPPPGVPSRTLNVPGSAAPSSNAPAGTAPSNLQQQEEAFQKRREEQQKADEKAAAATKDAALKEENCRRARASLATLESGRRILRSDEKGEQFYLDDATRAQEVERARQSVQEWCGG